MQAPDTLVIADSIGRVTGLSPDLQDRLLWTAMIMLALLVLRGISFRVVRRHVEDPPARYRWRKGTTYLFVVLGVLLIGRIWIEGFQAITTVLGLVAAAMVLTLKEPIVNLAGWLFVIWRRPFVVGDRIEIGSRAGDVVDLRLFEFSLLEIGNWVAAEQSTGRVVHVPNGSVFTESVANYTRGFPYIWAELPVRLTFESNWEKAKSILLGIADNVGQEVYEEAKRALQHVRHEYLILYSRLTPAVYTTVLEDGVALTMRFLVRPRERRGAEQEVWEAILREFARHDDLAFAYPTRRFFDNAREGKAGARSGLPVLEDRDAAG